MTTSFTVARRSRAEGDGALAVDVAIVGGGPAGTSTALFLVRAYGIAPESVAVFDKAVHPREKPCGGAVSAWGLEALARVGVGVGVEVAVDGGVAVERGEVAAVPMRGLRILDDGGRHVGVHEAARPLGVVVRRDAFDAMLWRRAREAGVTARDGEGIASVARSRAGWELRTTRGDRVRARFVVAADGAGSTVRKLAGLREPARKGHLYVLETPARLEREDPGPRAGLCDFDLTPADTIEGYYWDFPCVIDGAPFVSRGIFHANVHPSRDVKATLARELARRGIDIAACTLKPFSTRPFVRGTTLLHDDVLYVGEAAGIDAATGEGIAQAILFGEMAARRLAQALREGRRALREYPRDVARSRVGKHLIQSAWLARHVYGSRGAPFRKLLVRSASAREAGARWYGGEKLGLATWSVLGASLAREAARHGWGWALR